MAWDKYVLGPTDPGNVSLTNYIGTAGVGDGVFAVDLRRDVFGSISGIPIASSRQLEIVGTMTS